MGSIPSEYLDNLKEIILSTLNRIEQLRMRVLFGVQFVKGAYGQEFEFRSDGFTYLNGVKVGTGVIIAADLDMNGYNIVEADSIIADTAHNLTLTVDTGQAFVFSKV